MSNKNKLMRGEVPYHEMSEERRKQLEDPQRLSRGIPVAAWFLPKEVERVEQRKKDEAAKRIMAIQLIGHLITLRAQTQEREDVQELKVLLNDDLNPELNQTEESEDFALAA